MLEVRLEALFLASVAPWAKLPGSIRPGITLGSLPWETMVKGMALSITVQIYAGGLAI